MSDHQEMAGMRQEMSELLLVLALWLFFYQLRGAPWWFFLTLAEPLQSLQSGLEDVLL